MANIGDTVYCGTGDKPGTVVGFRAGYARVDRPDLGKVITMPPAHVHHQPYHDPKNDPGSWTPND